MLIAIVAFYAGLLGLIAVGLSIIVVRRRVANKVSFGTGGNPALEQAIRAHGNFIEYVPLTLLLLLLQAATAQSVLLEVGHNSAYWLHGLGIALVLARLAHAQGLLSSPGESRGRTIGVALTWIVLVVASIRAIVLGLSSF